MLTFTPRYNQNNNKLPVGVTSTTRNNRTVAVGHHGVGVFVKENTIGIDNNNHSKNHHQPETITTAEMRRFSMRCIHSSILALDD
jgi:hypothetical protein